MCVTRNKFERACGLLLLNEFKAFVYCCIRCQCEFDYSMELEVHILSEHQNDEIHMENVFVNDGITVNEATPIEYGPTSVKIEPCVEHGDAPNAEESVEINARELTDFSVNHEFDNDNNGNESNKTVVEVLTSRKRRERPPTPKKRKLNNVDKSFTAKTKESIIKGRQSTLMRNGLGSKRKKIDNDSVTNRKQTEESMPESSGIVRMKSKKIPSTSPSSLKKEESESHKRRDYGSTKLSEEKKNSLKNAWIDVKEGRMTIYRAAQVHDVNVSTLRKWCQRNDIDEQRPSVGRPCYLGKNLEIKLKHWISEAAKSGFPITPQLLKNEAHKYNEEYGSVDGWQPGDKWYYGFLHRNPDISLRTPQHISVNKNPTTETEVREWYQKINDFINEMGYEDCLKDVNRIFNMDETSFCVNPTLGKVLAKRGAKNVYTMSVKNEADCYTVLLGGSAAGHKTPPLIIFPGKSLPNQVNQMLPNKWHAYCSESGWMNQDIFYDYISNDFYPWLIKHGITTPVIVFVDGHVSHRSLKLSEFCYNNKIILVSFLPNMTHICQPMDVVVFDSVKQKWSSNLEEFRNLCGDLQRMPEANFCELLDQCVEENLTPELIKTAFVKTGLNPFDANSFNYSKLSTVASTGEKASFTS
ncbi:uncharacterized protein LOC129568930 [Sitodiplosis mosellana]|uniref:uncharacterized protein LOC129568930 n=1 Tax=Sitodiplosis mosellana TaxID=263140 RepID=UPI002444F4ED|nr:uncharacterized protein LOC129568930 [Sitodiplosis mosellana]